MMLFTAQKMYKIVKDIANKIYFNEIRDQKELLHSIVKISGRKIMVSVKWHHYNGEIEQSY